MDFFDFDFDFQDCVRGVLAGVFLLGSVQLHAALADQPNPTQTPERPPQAQTQVDEHTAEMLNKRDEMKAQDRARKGDKTLQRAEKVTGENHPEEHKDKGTTPGQ